MKDNRPQAKPMAGPAHLDDITKPKHHLATSGMYNVLFDTYKAGYNLGNGATSDNDLEEAFKAYLKDVSC